MSWLSTFPSFNNSEYCSIYLVRFCVCMKLNLEISKFSIILKNCTYLSLKYFISLIPVLTGGRFLFGMWLLFFRTACSAATKWKSLCAFTLWAQLSVSCCWEYSSMLLFAKFFGPSTQLSTRMYYKCRVPRQLSVSEWAL